MDKIRPLAPRQPRNRPTPLKREAETPLPPRTFQSPDQVTAFGIWFVGQNWNMAGCRKLLAGEEP